MRAMRRLLLVVLLLSVLACGLIGIFLYHFPPIHERLAWRIANLRAEIRYALNPPEEVVFVPQEQQDLIEAIVQATLQALTPESQTTQALSPATLTPTRPGLTASPSPSPTPTLTPTPIPEKVELTGIVHEYQKFNNCGPANLSMALSYWGWQGDQYDTRTYLRPSFEIDDKNVNPFEMVDFVETQTDFKALWRVGGDLELLKRFVAAGFPLVIEKGLQPPKEYWLGHYEIISGYDEANSQFIVYDSYIGPDYAYPIPYSEVANYWPHFNNVYVVIYPPDREAQVMALLGPQADPSYNFQYAAQKATDEATVLTGRDQFVAWYNRGSNLVYLGEYAAAAEAYDTAFAIFATLPEQDRPWRILWYQTGPYPAYYYTERYQDLINLAYTTLVNVDKPVLEETYYWRGMAREATGDMDGAIADLKRAADLNPRSTDAVEQLNRLGVEYP
jgi:tetratricopeptide (TPR) repeat protein